MESPYRGSAPLREALNAALPGLAAVNEEKASARPGGGPGWSRKQELGHLLDSATNNRVRFVNASLEGRYTGPGYSADGWVEQGGYAALRWDNILRAFTTLNTLLAEVIDRIPAAHLQAPCTVGDGAPVTLRFLVED